MKIVEGITDHSPGIGFKIPFGTIKAYRRAMERGAGYGLHVFRWRARDIAITDGDSVRQRKMLMEKLITVFHCDFIAQPATVDDFCGNLYVLA